jgi:hypothetical protein
VSGDANREVDPVPQSHLVDGPPDHKLGTGISPPIRPHDRPSRRVYIWHRVSRSAAHDVLGARRTLRGTTAPNSPVRAAILHTR